MDKLQWFKFYPSDWMMGKIMRCPEITQARFLRLCCLYWNKETSMSEEDARIEIDDEHFDILLRKKIILLIDGYISIAFLNDQLVGIMETSKKASIAGKKSAERRKVLAEQKKASVEQDPTNVEPLLNEASTTVQRNPTDKIVLDKIVLDKIKREEEESINSLVSLYPDYCEGRKTSTRRGGDSIKTKLKKILKKKSKEQVEASIKGYVSDCIKSNTYLMNFSKFLDELPEAVERIDPDKLDEGYVYYQWKHEPSSIARRIPVKEAKELFDNQAKANRIPKILKTLKGKNPVWNR